MNYKVDPVVSVIVTTKNEERNIGACLESVVQQSMPLLEIIVVDNYSEDKTRDIAREYGAEVFEKGPERSAQRNYGVEKALGQYILYLDADMRISSGLLEDCVNRCEADSEISLEIIAYGMHLQHSQGYTYSIIESDGYKKIHTVGRMPESDEVYDIAKGYALILKAFTHFWY